MAIGYSLSGYNTEKAFFFCYGPTNSGKSTFLEAILTAIGEYGGVAPFETFLAQKDSRGEAPSPFVIAMASRRFIKSMEPPTRSGRTSVTFNEGMIKELTGRDTTTARDMFGKPVTIKVMYHVWFGANDRPDVRPEAEPVWDRAKTIPFSRTFNGEKDDTSLKEKLDAEKAGILNYIIEGAAMWWAASAQGTRRALSDVPPEIKAATNDWRSENDLFAQFLADKCLTGDAHKEKSVTNAALYKAYRSWWAEQGLPESHPSYLSPSGIGRRLAHDGYTKDKDRRGARCWFGFALIDQRDTAELPIEAYTPL